MSSTTSSLGLSPRVRGNRLATWNAGTARRSIPACAGEPIRVVRLAIAVRVYPRVCGGTAPRTPSTCATTGLSPRVRGNLRKYEPTDRHSGSIPACAGEPKRQAPTREPDRVYPRVCGGTGRPIIGLIPDGTLSPRVRGNRWRFHRYQGSKRSIPACAGEPPSTTSAAISTAVYPRVCGGTICDRQAFTILAGLSPRVRGNRRPRHIAGQPVRSIPACAGEPTWM